MISDKIRRLPMKNQQKSKQIWVFWGGFLSKFTYWKLSVPMNVQQLSDYCLTPNEQFIGHIMTRTSYIRLGGYDGRFVLDQYA